jgi:hypothetical protein
MPLFWRAATVKSRLQQGGSGAPFPLCTWEEPREYDGSPSGLVLCARCGFQRAPHSQSVWMAKGGRRKCNSPGLTLGAYCRRPCSPRQKLFVSLCFLLGEALNREGRAGGGEGVGLAGR